MTILIHRRPIFSPLYGLGEPWVPVGNPGDTYNAAKTWLRQSNAAMALMNFVEESKLVVHLLTSEVQSMPNKFWIPEECAQLANDPFMPFNQNDVLVTWNPKTLWHVHQLKSKRPQGKFSEKGINKMGMEVRSEIVLIHEFGHVRQWLLRHDWYYAKWQAAMGGNNRANLDIEDDNLRSTESVVAKQMGQGIRWHYENNC